MAQTPQTNGENLDENAKPAGETTDADSKLLKRSMDIAGHRTSLSLENIFWRQLKRIAASHDQSVASLVAQIDATRGSANLSSAVRVYVLQQIIGETDDPV